MLHGVEVGRVLRNPAKHKALSLSLSLSLFLSFQVGDRKMLKLFS